MPELTERLVATTIAKATRVVAIPTSIRKPRCWRAAKASWWEALLWLITDDLSSAKAKFNRHFHLFHY